MHPFAGFFRDRCALEVALISFCPGCTAQLAPSSTETLVSLAAGTIGS